MSGTHKRDTGDQADSPLDITGMFRMLGNDARRRALHYLIEESDGVTDVEELAWHLHEREVGRSTTDHEDVVVQLYHKHLPKMEEVDAIEHDERSSTIRYQGDEVLEEVLSVVAAHDVAGYG